MSDGPLSPEEVAHRGFGTTFRGFDTGEVRTYLQRVASDLRAATARERDLHKRLAHAEHRAAHPVLEGDALTRALGDEMGRILASAQEAANGLRDKAEENAARILREAHEQAQRIRAQAEAILAVRTEEADAEATEIRRAAADESAGLVERAGQEAAAAMADVEGRARQLVHDAQAARARVLGDLTRRRRLLQTQVEQLRAGRERLLEAYRKVRSTTDEVADELQRVEDEARRAAGAAGDRAAAEPVPDDLDDVLNAFPGEPAVEGSDGAEALAPTGGAGVHPDAAPPEQAAVPVEAKAELAAQLASQAAQTADAVALEAEAAAAEAGGSSAADRTNPPPHQVSTRPGGERGPLRLLRRAKGDSRPLDVVSAPSKHEAVRVIPPGPEPVVAAAAASPPESEPPAGGPAMADADAGADAVAEATAPSTPGPDEERTVEAVDAPAPPSAPAPPVPPPSEAAAADAVAGVDELFARIRAGRADAVARAHEVLGADTSAPVQAGVAPAPGAAGAPADVGPPGRAEEETLLQRRDAAVEGMALRLARKLKRALQDEQNEVLDRLRSAKAGVGPDAALPAVAEQAGPYRQAAEELLRASAAAGMAFVTPPDGTLPEAPHIAMIVDELATSLVEPLRRALERALSSGGSGDGDQTAVVDRIGAAYRECKAQRVEGLAGDAVIAAFSRGALAAMPAGTASRWVVDDDGRPCPDCDDNALAGPTPAGDEFPTGQAHPPAHAGCRCLLAPAELAAAVPGGG